MSAAPLLKRYISMHLVAFSLIALHGCGAVLVPPAPKPPATQPVSPEPASTTQIRQLLLVANGTIQELAIAGVISPQELAIANGVYAAGVAALDQYDADIAAGDQPGADLALAAAEGYLEELAQTHVKAVRRPKTAAPATRTAMLRSAWRAS